MAKKQFKIGEYAVGGIIAVEVVGFAGDIIQIKALDYNSKKVVKEKTFVSPREMEVDFYLNDLTSSYYAGKVLDWIKTKFKFN
jgi:hypothetical protein